jgi:hypothetical protein
MITVEVRIPVPLQRCKYRRKDTRFVLLREARTDIGRKLEAALALNNGYILE